MAGGQITTAVIELFGVSSAALATHARMFEQFTYYFCRRPHTHLGSLPDLLHRSTLFEVP